jgi:hypothetical protein
MKRLTGAAAAAQTRRILIDEARALITHGTPEAVVVLLEQANAKRAAKPDPDWQPKAGPCFRCVTATIDTTEPEFGLCRGCLDEVSADMDEQRSAEYLADARWVRDEWPVLR